MNGVIVAYKPKDFTSFDVIAKLRRTLGTKSIGHGGTLDPMATGVLPLYIGKSTKAVDLNPNKTKRYLANFKFGIRTDTGDITGDEIETSDGFPTNDELMDATLDFVGNISQLPPMYSAVKIGGKKLYQLAREGKTVERKPREIEIYGFNILDIDRENKVVTADISCSQGTYIRTLCEDFAQSLNHKATLCSLERTESGGFSVEQSFTIEEITAAVEGERVDEVLMSVETVFKNYRKLELNQDYQKRYLNGMTLNLNQDINDGIYRVYLENSFHSLCKVTDKKLKKVKSFE